MLLLLLLLLLSFINVKQTKILPLPDLDWPSHPIHPITNFLLIEANQIISKYGSFDFSQVGLGESTIWQFMFWGNWKRTELCEDCSCDKLEIYDSMTPYRLSSLQLSSYTRTFYASTNNIMTLDLTTDFTVNDKGFKAAWKEVNWTGTRMWLVGLYSNLQFLINSFVLIFRAQHLCIYDPCELMGLHCCDFFGHISF